jgi:hypothetical protein
MKKNFILSMFITGALLLAGPVLADASLPLRLDILSSKTLNGIAGDYVTVQGQITNTGTPSLTDITTYLSLVDTQNKLPVDLEDWSAEKGLFIGTIEPNQTLPLNWKIHFVKAGDYSLVVVATSPASDTPQVSKITHFHVDPKHNLNPGKVLPVALGTPIVLLCIMGVLNYWRQRQQG